MPHSTTKKNRRSILILGISLISFASLLAFPSFAWLIAPQTSSPIGSALTGKANGSYFNGGDGSADHPYEIDNALQLYYFNWLQDLGYFNKREGKTSSGEEDTSTPIKQIYFKLTSDIDASSSCLPPAGTTQYPFVGNFNGDGHVIKGLTITNDKSKLKRIPQDASFTDGLLDNAEIVGFFGIIGQYKEELDYTIKNVAEDGTVTYVNEVSNLYFDDLNVDTAASKSLTGLIAGYVNGNLSYCGVRAGSLTYATSTGTLDGYDQLSKYSLIGDYNTENFTWKGQPKKAGSNDWGGTINVYELSRRMTYIINDTMAYNSFQAEAKPNRMGLNYVIYNKYKTNDVFYKISGLQARLKNSYLPLNVDTTTEFAGGEITGTKEESKTKYWATATTSFFANSTNESEIILKSNPGYITSDDSDQHTYHYIYPSSNVSNSLGGTSFSEDNLVMLTFDGNNNLARIVDGQNTANNTSLNSAFTNSVEASSLSQYSNVKEKLGDVITNNLIYTLAWGVGTTSSYSTMDGTFQMNGTTYSKLLSPGIDFVVQEAGYITAVFCSITNSGGANDLFSLYKVTRSSDGTPTEEQITDLFPSATDTTFPKSKALLYLQIPVEAGEYFISGKSASTSAGFMYLDIGANAQGTTPSPGTDSSPDIDFVYYEDEAATTKKILKINDKSYVASGVYFSVGTSPTSVYYWRNSSGSGVFYCVLPSSASSAIVSVGTGSSVKKDQPYSTEETSGS